MSTSYKDSLQLPKVDMPINANLIVNEPAVYKQWHDANVYLRMKRDNQNPFVLHDGPPYANGDIHIGHALNKILKDFIVKFNYFNGRSIDFVPGWDCHGLPIEQAVQATADKPKDKQTVSVMCRKHATLYLERQKEQFKSLGVVADWDYPYYTMSAEFESMIADSVNTLKDKGLLVQRQKPIHWSWRFETALAEAEVEYKDKKDNSIYLVFKTTSPTYPYGMLVWTTTPWTLPANVAVAVNPDADYICVHVKNIINPVIVAAELVAKLCEIGVVTGISSKRLYKGSIFKEWKLLHPINKQVVPVINAEFVSVESGTGCVHIAPGHGEEDYQVGLKHNLPVTMIVGPDGKFKEGEYNGQHVFDANDIIIDDLRKNGSLVDVVEIVHSYPYCSRSNTPIIFRATEQWFLDLDKIRESIPNTILSAVEFHPERSKDRLAAMVQNRVDWCISRQRLWGVKIPDSEDVLDVWFDSGLTWNTLDQKQADVYIEGNDQHRGWFQSSLWLSIALQNKLPFKKVITHGFVVDQNGHKMSKSKGNVVSPLDVTKKYGTEVLRFWVANVDYTKDMQCSDTIIKQAAEGYKKLRNTLRFLVANMPDDKPMEFTSSSLLPVDRWIYNKSQEILSEVHDLFADNYFCAGMHRLMGYVVSDLSGIYMNAAKDRLYCDSVNSNNRRSAIYVMQHILWGLIELLAPILTYTANEVLNYCPAWMKGDIKDIFDTTFHPLPKLPTSIFTENIPEDYYKQALDAFHVKFTDIKAKGLVRDTLEVVIELNSRKDGFFALAEDWFGTSGCTLCSAYPALTEFAVGDTTYKVVKSQQNRCDRCWKRKAVDNLCLRCKRAIDIASC